MTCFIKTPYLSWRVRLNKARVRQCTLAHVPDWAVSLCEAAICTQDLCVDPASVWSGQKRNDVSNILWLAQALKRCKLAELCDLLWGLTLKEQIRSGWPRRDGIHRDVATTKLVCEHRNEPFATSLRGDVWTVCWE